MLQNKRNLGGKSYINYENNNLEKKVTTKIYRNKNHYFLEINQALK